MKTELEEDILDCIDSFEASSLSGSTDFLSYLTGYLRAAGYDVLADRLYAMRQKRTDAS